MYGNTQGSETSHLATPNEHNFVLLLDNACEEEMEVETKKQLAEDFIKRGSHCQS